MTIAYAGAPGAFAHEACLTFAPGREPIAVAGFKEVVAAVAERRAAAGMIPVRNSRAGAVPGVADLLARGSVKVVSEHVLAVRMHLMAVPGVTLSEVRTVRSHPVALAQCRDRLDALGLATAPAPNTAVAARDLVHRDEAALASAPAAEAYGLTILLRDLQDNADNHTIFALIARA